MMTKNTIKTIAGNILTFAIVCSISVIVDFYWVEFLFRAFLYLDPTHGTPTLIAMARQFAIAFISGLAGFALVSSGIGSKKAVFIVYGLVILASFGRTIKYYGVSDWFSPYYILQTIALLAGAGVAFVVVHFLGKAIRKLRK